jgi:hypothetical protein
MRFYSHLSDDERDQVGDFASHGAVDGGYCPAARLS